MWNCCCEYKDQEVEDDGCPDWCDSTNRRVKGRFGLAFVADTPCCCPEPIGWQVEFCDTPSKVEQRCKEMVQWANCPPLPRCEPCPPIEVMSPCFPPRCNPRCPISNPCPPRCPPRCCPCPCPCPRPVTPRKKCCPKMQCSCCVPPKSKQKCCCSKSKNKCRCDTNDEDEDEEDDNESCCQCKKDDEREFKTRRRRDAQSDRERDRYRRSRDRYRRSRDRDSDRGDRDREKERDRDSSQRSSFYEDEVPVKESKLKPEETTENPVHRINTPPPYRTSNQRTATPPRPTPGRNTPAQSKMNTQNLSTSSQANNPRRDSSRNVKSSSGSMRKPSNTSPLANDSNEELFIDFTTYYEPNCDDCTNQAPEVKKDVITNKNEEIVSYIHYQPNINDQSEHNSRSRDIHNSDVVNLYKRGSKDDNSFDNLALTKSYSTSCSARKVSKSIESKTPIVKASKLSDAQLCSIIMSSMKVSKQSQPLGTFTNVFSNKDPSEFEEFIVKRRKWLPYEFIKNVRRRVVGFFKNINIAENEDDTESNCSYNVYDDVYKKLMLENKDIGKN